MEFLNIDLLTTLAAFSISLSKIWSALSIILGLGLVIFFHELGHFAVAKWCDVHVERFSIGIGPIIWSRQKGETEYALSAFPFGGYVKMLGQDDMDSSQMASDEIAENPRSYTSKKVWQRMAIISAGVIMNVITGFLFFAISYRYGVSETVPMAGQIFAGGPAWQAGLQPGDSIDRINGSEVQNFMEITEGIVLTKGAITVDGKKQDGTEFSVTINPKMNDRSRAIGLASANTLKISDQIPEGESVILPGSAAQRASAEFKRGDKIVAINGAPVTYFHEMTAITARDAGEDLVCSVERTTSSEEGASNTETLQITIPPKRMKSTGVLMMMGPITALKEDSIAAKAGLLMGDEIIRVGELEVSKDIDALRLPNYFAEHAGEEVIVIVRRQTEEDGKDEVSLAMVPESIAGWSSRPNTPVSALLIPSIGAGFHIQTRVAGLAEGSEAASDPNLKQGQKITKVEFVHPDPENIVADGYQDEPVVIDIAKIESGDKNLGSPNWAYVHWMVQQMPNRHVRLHVGESGEGDGSIACTLEKGVYVDGWYSPIRGIRGFEPYSRIRQADSWGEAFALGLRHTKSKGISLYMTLRALFNGNLNAKSLSGPVGIASIGYQVAEAGMTSLLNFLGFLSLNLAVLNFLPIPVLDGGHMVFLIWEGVARKKPSPRVIGIAHSIGLLLIISLFVFVMYQDIYRILT